LRLRRPHGGDLLVVDAFDIDQAGLQLMGPGEFRFGRRRQVAVDGIAVDNGPSVHVLPSRQGRVAYENPPKSPHRLLGRAYPSQPRSLGNTSGGIDVRGDSAVNRLAAPAACADRRESNRTEFQEGSSRPKGLSSASP
jgi:hypothetical protein